MLKHTFLALLWLCAYSLSLGQASQNVIAQDTIILQRSDTTFTFDHVIDSGQTIYSLSKLYQTTLPEIHAVNPGLMETELGIGDTISMPLNVDLIQYKAPRKVAHSASVFYKIQSGETLFAIARRWLQTDTDRLKKINNLESAVLGLHQELQLGWIDTRFKAVKKEMAENAKISEMDQALVNATKESLVGSEPVIEGGKAIWKASKTAGDKPFILHRKAKINSLVQLYNPMTGKKIHAKVVGRIPERNYEDNVMVVLTPYLANALKARDQSFFLKMKYVM